MQCVTGTTGIMREENEDNTSDHLTDMDQSEDMRMVAIGRTA